MDSLLPAAHAVAERLKARKETIAVSESSTGGLISAVLLAVPGASAYFMGGGVVYTRKAHQTFLNVPPEQLQGIRSSSEPYALLNARTIRARFETTWGLAETGASGPTGNRYGDAAGHTCYAVVGSGIERVATLETGSDDRVANMRRFAAAALQMLHDALR